MRISELSQLTGVSIRSLRYYEQKQLITAKRLNNGYREFDLTVVERVHAIQLYLGLGLNTFQIRQILNCTTGSTLVETGYVCDGARALYEEKLGEVTAQIQLLQSIRDRLQERISIIHRLKDRDATDTHAFVAGSTG